MPTPETDEVLHIAREWFTASVGGLIGQGQFSSFITVWIAFNALYALLFGNQDSERKQVRAVGSWPPAIDIHRSALALSDYQHSIAVLAQNGVYNFLSNRVERIADTTDLCQVLSAVYLVRCNLFHGRKTVTNMRDHDLVEAARLITYRLVGGLLNNSTIWEEVA